MSSVIINPNKANNNPRIDFSGNAITAFIDISANARNIFELGTQTGDISLVTAGTDRFRILNNGNVGIGNPNPSYLLDVSGSNTLGLLNLRNTSSGYANNAFANFLDTNTNANYQYINIGTSLSTQRAIQLGLFYPSQGSINPSGFLGIYGCANFLNWDANGYYFGGLISTPPNSGTYKIQVDGNVYVNGALTIKNSTVKYFPPIALGAQIATITGQSYGNGTYYTFVSSDRADASSNVVFDKQFNPTSGGAIMWQTTYTTNGSTTTTPPVYTTDVSGNAYQGEYAQIILPVPIVLSYYITSVADTGGENLPTGWTVLGSNNGSAWYLLDKQDVLSPNGYGTFNVSTTNAYTYFRYVYRTSSGIYPVLASLRYYGVECGTNISNTGNVQLGNMLTSLTLNRNLVGQQQKVWNSDDLLLYATFTNTQGLLQTFPYYILVASFNTNTGASTTNYGLLTLKGFIGSFQSTSKIMFDIQLGTKGTSNPMNTSPTNLPYINGYVNCNGTLNPTVFDFAVCRDSNNICYVYLKIIGSNYLVMEFVAGGNGTIGGPNLSEPTATYVSTRRLGLLGQTVVIPSLLTQVSNTTTNKFYFSGSGNFNKINLNYNGTTQDLGNVILNTTTQTIQIEPINMPYTKATKSLTYNTGVAIYSNNIKADVTTSSITAPTTVTFGPKKPFMMVAGGQGTNTLAYSYDGITWFPSTTSSSIFTVSVQSIVWDGVKFVAGGQGTNILGYSYDGITWTASVATNGLFGTYGLCVAYNGQRYVASGDAGSNTLAYSNDGITWTGVGASVIAVYARSVACNSQRFVACGGNNGGNTLAYSNDGITWTGLGSSVFTNSGWSAAYGGKRWVAGGQGGNTLAYSNDGITWTGAGASVITTTTRAFAWNGQRWVAGGQGGNALAYSNDGITWTGLGTSILGNCYSLLWNGRMFIAGGDTGNTMAYSYDGITWTGASGYVFSSYCVALADNTALANSVTINTNYFLAGGDASGNTIAYSTDGITWTGCGKTVFTSNCYGFGYDGVKWIAGGKGGNTLAYSYNGINWTGLGSSVFTTSCAGIRYNGQIWVASGEGGNTLAYSYDGINWTGNSSFFSNGGGSGIPGWNGKMWLVCGYGDHIMVYSYDGINWTSVPSPPFSSAGYTPGWNGKLWVGCGYGGVNTLAYSYDGINWTGLGSSIFPTVGQAAIWNGNMFVAIGYQISGTSYKAAYSYDGINWTLSTSANTVFNGAGPTTTGVPAWNGKYWVTGGGGGNVIGYSSDGINWSPSSNGNTMFTTLRIVASTQQMAPSGNPIPTVNVNMQPMYVGVGEAANSLVYSYDGYNFIIIGKPLFTSGRMVAWNGKIWLASGYGDNTLGYSYDGINWTGLGSSIFNNEIRSIASNGQIWLCGGYGNSINNMAYSYDGINWTGLGTSSFSSYCSGIVWTGKKFFACGSGGNTLVSSSDGINWTGITSPFSTACNGIGFNGRMFVAGGSGGNILAYSYDGITWTGSASSPLTTINNLSSNTFCWNGQKWIVCGGGGNTAAYSTNGINWTGCGAFGYDMRSVIWDGKNFIATGYNFGSSIFYSSDGINWSNRNISTSTYFNVAAGCIACTYPLQNGLPPLNQKLYLTNNNYGSSTTLQFSTDSYYQPGYNDINISVTSSNI